MDNCVWLITAQDVVCAHGGLYKVLSKQTEPMHYAIKVLATIFLAVAFTCHVLASYESNPDFAGRVMANAYVLPIAGINMRIEAAMGFSDISLGASTEVSLSTPLHAGFRSSAFLSRKWMSIGIEASFDTSSGRISSVILARAAPPPLPLTVGLFAFLTGVRAEASVVENPAASTLRNHTILLSPYATIAPFQEYLPPLLATAGFEFVSTGSNGEASRLATWVEAVVELRRARILSRTRFGGMLEVFTSQSLSLQLLETNLTVTGSISTSASGDDVIVKFAIDYAFGNVRLLPAYQQITNEAVVCDGDTCIVIE